MCRPNLRPPPAPRLRIRLRSSGRQKTSATDVPQQDDIDTHQERLSEPDFDPEAEVQYPLLGFQEKSVFFKNLDRVSFTGLDLNHCTLS